MPTLNKLEYLNETKSQIKSALNTNFNSGITDSDTFRSYVGKISDIYTNWHKVTGTGTDLELTPTKKGKLAITPKGNSSQFSTDGYQMLDISKYPYNSSESVLNGATVTVNGGMITVDTRNASATATIKSSTPSTDNRIILPAGTYYFAVRTNGYLIDGETSTFKQYIEGVNTLPSSYRISQWYVPVLVGGIVSIPLLISNNSSKTSYEPYTGGIALPNPDYPQNVKSVTGENVLVISNSDNTETQSYPISLGNIELCKINDYQDYIYKSGDNWYKKEYIVKKVLNGSEGWVLGTTNTNRTSFYLGLSDIYSYTTPNSTPDLLCTHYKTVSENVTWRAGQISMQSGYKRIYIMRPSGETLSEFETELATQYNNNNPVIVYYLLATSIDVQITDTTLISQLNNIYNICSCSIFTIIYCKSMLTFCICYCYSSYFTSFRCFYCWTYSIF